MDVNINDNKYFKDYESKQEHHLDAKNRLRYKYW